LARAKKKKKVSRSAGARARSADKPQLVVAICGGSASGKSWLSADLTKHLSGNAVVVCQDWYYRDHSHKSAEECEKLNFDHPDAIEMPLMLKQVKQILAGNSVEAPIYVYNTHGRSRDTRTVRPAPVVILEGLFVLHDKRLRDMADLSVFIDVPADERLLRRIRRDVEQRRVDLEETLRLYENYVRPMHEEFIQPSGEEAVWRWRQLEDEKFPEQLLREIRLRLRRSQ
jgi:uridine kinase